MAASVPNPRGQAPGPQQNHTKRDLSKFMRTKHKNFIQIERNHGLSGIVEENIAKCTRFGKKNRKYQNQALKQYQGHIFSLVSLHCFKILLFHIGPEGTLYQKVLMENVRNVLLNLGGKSLKIR